MKRKPSRKTSKKRNKRNGVQNPPAQDIQNPTLFSHDSYYDYSYQVPDHHGAIEAENKYLLEQVQWLERRERIIKRGNEFYKDIMAEIGREGGYFEKILEKFQ